MARIDKETVARWTIKARDWLSLEVLPMRDHLPTAMDYLKDGLALVAWLTFTMGGPAALYLLQKGL